MSGGEHWVQFVGGISKALILTGCTILIGLRIMIPLFDFAAVVPWEPRMPARAQRDLTMMDW